MPSFAELKQKATKAKDATVTSVQNTKDRHTSVPLKKTNWNPYDGSRPSPPPPPQSKPWAKPPKPEPPMLPPPVRRGTFNSPGPSPQPSPPPPPPALPGRASSATRSGGPPPINRASRPLDATGSSPAPSPAPPPRRPTLPSRTSSSSSSSFSSPQLPSPAIPSRVPSLPSRAPSLPSRAPSLPSRAPSYTNREEVEEEEEEPNIDWINLSQEDKEAFFEWLDEFFERSYGISRSTLDR